jgi:DNA-formamidopyrimidine glycosylase
MPEGPEVTIIAEGLNNILSGSYILDFEFNSKSRYSKKAPDGYLDFQKSLIDGLVKVIEVRNKGKFIYWTFSNGFYLLQTLGLSGGWFREEKRNSGCHLFFKDNKTYEVGTLFYDDQRRFGTMKFTNDKQVLENKLSQIGPDLLNDKEFDVADWLRIFHKPRNQNKLLIKLITDQKIMSGIGNYLRAEILYEAKLSPHRIIHTLSDKELSKLYKAAKYCITESYKQGGTSIQHYSDVNDKPGTYGLELKVYRKKKDPQGKSIKPEKIAKDSQTTYWVPGVQK